MPSHTYRSQNLLPEKLSQPDFDPEKASCNGHLLVNIGNRTLSPNAAKPVGTSVV